MSRRININKPKRLLILKKSKYMRRWLLRNPWVKPMCVFNYATILIQKIFRGYSIRKTIDKSKNRISKSKKVIKESKRNKNKQLDRYLVYLDKCKKLPSKLRPSWLDQGYSTWCAVRIQAMYRKYQLHSIYLKNKKLINQVASIIIQTMVRIWLYKVRHHAKRIIMDDSVAALSIQLCWRSFCNRRIYHYFRDLILIKLKGYIYNYTEWIK